MSFKVKQQIQYIILLHFKYLLCSVIFLKKHTCKEQKRSIGLKIKWKNKYESTRALQIMQLAFLSMNIDKLFHGEGPGIIMLKLLHKKCAWAKRLHYFNWFFPFLFHWCMLEPIFLYSCVAGLSSFYASLLNFTLSS